jgi:glycopeptide antibiotics resistance protein
MRDLAAVAMTVYLLLLIALTFLPFGEQGGPIEVRLNLFQTIRGALRLGPGSQEYSVLIGNLLAFVPLGVLVPLVMRRCSWVVAIGAGLALSVAIEIVQCAASVALGFNYRTADVDDVVVNTLGTAVGYIGFALIGSLRTRLDATAGRG